MSTTTTTRAIDRTAVQATLYIAFELGNGSWKLGFTTGLGQRPRERNVPARDVEAVLEHELANIYGFTDRLARGEFTVW